LRFDAHLLEDKVLYACFKRSATAARLAEVFRAGLRKIDADAIVAGYMEALDDRAAPARVSP
jgi:polar amino acid transport system substrate-binding protein